MAGKDTTPEDIVRAVHERETITVTTSARNLIGLHDAHVYAIMQAPFHVKHIGEAVHHELDLVLAAAEVDEDIDADRLVTVVLRSDALVPALVSLVQMAQALKDGVIFPSLGQPLNLQPLHTIPTARLGWQVLLEDQYPEIAAHLEALFR